MPALSLPSPASRRVGTPRWIDLRLFAGVGLVLASVLLGAHAVASAQRTERRLIAVHDLAVGTQLTAADVAYRDVRLSSPGRYAAAPERLVGRTLTVPLRRGELVPLSSVARTVGHTDVAVPLPAAAAPPLTRGERVALWLSTSTCTAALLVDGAAVQSVRAAGGYTGDGSQQVVLSLTPAVADRLVEALAIPNSTVRAGIEFGNPGAAVSLLPPLSSCESTAATPPSSQ